jgi:retron-type reverse transcriptase
VYDKVCSKEVLDVAWNQVRRNRGAAGVDGETIDAIEAQGVEQFLAALREELTTQRYRPMPVRRVYIPKPDGRQRPLGIPRIRDRVVQAAVRLVIEPLFEASFRPGSYGSADGEEHATPRDDERQRVVGQQRVPLDERRDGGHAPDLSLPRRA